MLTSLNDRGRVMLAGAAIVAIVLGGAVAGASALGVARSVMGARAGEGEGVRAGGAGFEERLELAQRRVDGRSLFFTPPRPRPPAPPPVRVDPPPRGPTIPTRYAGPQVIAIINNLVWFDDGSKLAPKPVDVSGSDGVDAGSMNGLAVWSVDPPWSVRVWWSGREWTLDLFERNVLVPMFEPPTPVVPAPAIDPVPGNGTGGIYNDDPIEPNDGNLFPEFPDEPVDDPSFDRVDDRGVVGVVGAAQDAGGAAGSDRESKPMASGVSSGGEEPDDA